MDKTYKLSDSVIARIAQILQEGILMGVDIVDLLRMVEVETFGEELVLTKGYVERVKASHDDALAKVEQLKSERNKSRVVIGDLCLCLKVQLQFCC
jgi:hypothetical protein